jgi:hypothetical protein
MALANGIKQFALSNRPYRLLRVVDSGQSLSDLFPTRERPRRTLVRIIDNRGQDHLYDRRAGLAVAGEPEILSLEAVAAPGSGFATFARYN